MGDYGIKISQSGYDVKTCPDDKLIMSSKFNLFKIHASGSGSTVVPAETFGSINIAHNLEYSPSFLVYYLAGNGWWQQVNSGGLQYSPTMEGNNDWGIGHQSSDDTNVTLWTFNITLSSKTVYYYYFIFKDEIQV